MFESRVEIPESLEDKFHGDVADHTFRLGSVRSAKSRLIGLLVDTHARKIYACVADECGPYKEFEGWLTPFAVFPGVDVKAAETLIKSAHVEDDSEWNDDFSRACPDEDRGYDDPYAHENTRYERAKNFWQE